MLSVQNIAAMVDANREEALAFFQQCVRTPSVTGSEAAMGEVVRQFLARQGFAPQVYEKEPGRPNIVAEWKGARPGPRFVWNGHLDVFPPVAGSPGLYGPWAGKVADGYLYGRGSVDMKGGVCAAIMATAFLKRMGFSPAGSVLMTWVSDEENTGGLGTKYLLEQGLISGDFGIDSEPTHGQVLVSHCGGLNVKVTYRSAAGHTSIPHPEGADALEKTVNAAAALMALGRRISRYSEELGAWSKLSVTMIESGNTVNMYPSEGHLVIDRRLVPGETTAEGHRQIREVLDGLRRAHPQADYSYEYEVLGEYPCLVVDENEPIVRMCLEAYREVTGKDTAVYRRGGGSDASDIVEKTGLPMPNFGAGDEEAESTHENEKLCLEDYFTFIKVYMRLLVKALS